MAREKKNSKLGALLVGPALIIVGVLALWENEGRFDFAKAARQATVVGTPAQAQQAETFAYTGQLETAMPIAGYYVKEFTGYYQVTRNAEIYCWDKDEDSDGHTTWDKEWMSSVESNSRNNGLRQTLEGGQLRPEKYELGDLVISPKDIHLVDPNETIPAGKLVRTQAGRDAGLLVDRDYFFKGQGSIASPELGDERIEYLGVHNVMTASYFGALEGDQASGKQFEISQSFLSRFIGNDGVLHHLVNGNRETALGSIKGYFTKVLWLTRLGGTAAVVFGMMATMSVFLGLLYHIPLLGNLVEWGAFLVSLVLGVTLSAMVIVTSYIAHSPVLIALVLVLVAVGVYLLLQRSRTTKKNVQTTLHDYQARHAVEGYDIDVDAATGWSPNFAEQTFQKLVTMAAINGLSHKETKFLERWGELNGVAKSRIDEMLENTSGDAEAMEVDTRNDMILLVCVALADGMLSGRELSALKAIARRIGMKMEVLAEIIAGVEAGTIRPS